MTCQENYALVSTVDPVPEGPDRIFGNDFFEGVLGFESEFIGFLPGEDQRTLSQCCLYTNTLAELQFSFNLKWFLVEADPDRASEFRLWGPRYGY